MHKKLFIPGPIEVHPDILKACSTPMISHRGKDYEDLHGRLKSKLRAFFNAKGGSIFLFTSSSTGAMEAAVRNLVGKCVLSCTCGAFSERWFEIAKENGKEAEACAAEWGFANKPEEIDKRLATGKVDAITVVHNETSTGVMNPIEAIARVVRRYPDVMFCVDAVSSMAGVKIEPEALGIDVLLAGVQKAWGLPPGLTICYVSDRALAKARTVPHRGHYFDFVQMKKFDEKNQTPETPVLPLLFALDAQLDRMMKEGFDNRYARTLEMAQACRAWAQERFALFPEKGYESVTLTAVLNNQGADIGKLNAELARRGAMISEGYGKIKAKTFRIAHMGDISMDDLRWLLGEIDDILRLKG
ncbi:MAG: alanine--glyoxylate aminotransferase family protein [Planctomycetes bacterium]|nr:alanine--glyoxylate aminotransferase family protein [Planctomycetota bacterium]